MKIQALAQRTGLTAPTIRFYEKEGLLNERLVRRGENNYRDYAEEAVEHLRMIKKIQSIGFTIAELKLAIQADEADELSLSKVVELLRRKLEVIRRKKKSWSRLKRISPASWPTRRR